MVSKLDMKKQRGENTRKALIKSTIDCLDRLGYAETSINRVLEGVDVSRGALMHHFPSKEDLVIGTVDFLLSRILRHYQQESPSSFPFAQITQAEGGTLADALVTYWRNIIDTPEGRAFSEIIMQRAPIKHSRSASRQSWKTGTTSSTSSSCLRAWIKQRKRT
ncbi:TetR/AcrR family transcriptional regulator [Pseudovibrio denitrificans]|uniref:TetR/AcrR family transcriptional regulator n=1 Tax=Pseudovibrio denitrificans TaxID=258256 RepID=UPI000A597662|nr:TetR/AcrR family transcriptional regulator [Pseudovibrio denitrificans]